MEMRRKRKLDDDSNEHTLMLPPKQAPGNLFKGVPEEHNNNDTGSKVY